MSVILRLLCLGTSGRPAAPERLKLSSGHWPAKAVAFPAVTDGCETGSGEADAGELMLLSCGAGEDS